MPDLTPELIGRLADVSGFGFEMRMGKTLRLIPEAKVEHGGTYRPLGILDAHRQFDYRFRLQNGNRVLRLAVECKNFFVGSPVVVCGCSRTEQESRLDLVVSDARWVDGIGDPKYKAVGVPLQTCPSKFYPKGEFVGKATMRPEPCSRAKEDVANSEYRLTGDSDIYEKWNQAAMHTAFLANATGNESKATPEFTACLPIVVVPDDRLWTITYNEDGEQLNDPQPSISTTLFVGVAQHIPSLTGPRIQLSHIHLMTAKGLQGFIEKLADPNHQVWSQMFDGDTMDAYNSNRNRPIKDN